MEFSSFPKNLAYKISQLQGFSKTCVKLTPDRTSVSSGETFRVKMPSNTLIDLRTFTLHAKGTASKIVQVIKCISQEMVYLLALKLLVYM